MGLPDRDGRLARALARGLERDLAEVAGAAAGQPDSGGDSRGLETLVGPRGVKLSGGQVQRAAAARMFVREPELLVVDDLSSALDVETERELWERLACSPGRDLPGGLPPACGAARADRIVVLVDGRVEDSGRLDDLLARCAELRRLWTGEAIELPEAVWSEPVAAGEEPGERPPAWRERAPAGILRLRPNCFGIRPAGPACRPLTASG